MAPAIFAGSALLSLISWASITHQLVCIGAPMPTDVQVVGEGAFDEERTWTPVGERCTWATAAGGTVTTTHYELGESAGMYGGAAGMLVSVAVFVISARSGDDELYCGSRTTSSCRQGANTAVFRRVWQKTCA